MSISVDEYKAMVKNGEKRGRYGKNKRISTKLGNFDSRGEYNRYLYLLDLEKAGVIQNLERQIVYSFDLNGQHICKYNADFRYSVGGQQVIEDFKMKVLPKEFVLKRKLMLAFYGIDVYLVRKVRAAVGP